jgi:guanylate kinase
MDKKIYILIGPSASGKTTLGRFLQDNGVEELVSHTTRDMRDGEEEGLTYYYTTRDKFDGLKKVEKTVYDGNFYCLSAKEIESKLEDNDRVFVIMDRYGTNEMLESEYNDLIEVVYIKVGYVDILMRLMSRDGIIKAFRRFYHALVNKEFNNGDIADRIIENNEGNLEKTKRELMDFINNS